MLELLRMILLILLCSALGWGLSRGVLFTAEALGWSGPVWWVAPLGFVFSFSLMKLLGVFDGD